MNFSRASRRINELIPNEHVNVDLHTYEEVIRL